MIPSPSEIADLAEEGLLKKAMTPWGTTFVSAMFAGALIAIGFIFYTTSQVGAEALPYGVAKVLGGVVFSTGLALVIILGADLFTSTTMTLMPGVDRRLPWGRLLAHWGVVYLGNFFGSLLVAITIFLSGTPHTGHGGWGAVVISASVSKVSHTPVEAFFLGILCNVLVCLAVWAGYAGKSVTDKMVAVTLPIAVFVASGFEHSVANMFMLPLGLMIKAEGNPEVMAAIANGTDVDALTVPAVLLSNLLPVTLGNIVGGGVFIGLGMFIWHRRGSYRKTAEASARYRAPREE
ncbi:formate transporter FocA [Bowdeniella nasicola]|nr:formate transporter FocA [Bowdeniella nasicola]